MFNGIKNLLGIDEDDEDDYEDYEEEEVKETPEPKKVLTTPKIETPALKIAPVSPVKGFTANTSQFKMVIVEPSSFEDSTKLVDSLKARKPVIINLGALETTLANKIFDFLSGATYALGGNAQRIAPNIFVFAPENVDISTNIQSGGLEIPELKSWAPFK